MNLVLNEEALKQLTGFIQEMPVKYGVPLLNFLNEKVAEQNKGEKETPQAESVS
ncbi:MAG TPA: hypothetical protein V6C58_04970 [Allocoleopsis sp.]